MRNTMGLVTGFGILLGFALFGAPSAHAATAGESSEKVDASEFISQPPSVAFEVGYFMPIFPNYAGTPGNGYPASKGFRLGIEYLPYTGRFGKVSVGGGISYGKVRGSDTRPFLEVYPLELGLTYRFDYVQNQFIVPYVRAGLERTFLRSQFGGKHTRFDGMSLGGGLAFCFDYVDSNSAQIFEQSIGVKNTYLLIDVQQIGFLGDARADEPNLTRTQFSVNLRMEI